MDPIFEMDPHNLVKRLVDMGWTQEQIAKALDVTQPTVCRMATSPHVRPRHDIVDRLRKIVYELDGFAA